MTVGVLADTHIPTHRRRLPAEVHEIFNGVALALHAGDVVSPTVIEELEGIAPTYVVRGNMDYAIKAPVRRVVPVGDCSIGLIHVPPTPLTEEAIREAVGVVDCLVHGHTHKPRCERVGNILVFNPGPVTPGVTGGEPSVGLLEVGEELIARRIPLP